MAQYRPGAATAMVTGAIAASGTVFNILARQVVLDERTRVREVTADGDSETVYATNDLVGGTCLIVGWSDSASAITIGNLGDSTTEDVDITIMPFAAAGKQITVSGTPERVRVAYEKSDVGVALSITMRVSAVVHA
jgi:hypothetical protein